VADRGRRRKLAAILSADVVGYSHLMRDDEAATVATLKEYRAAIARVIDRQKGRVVVNPRPVLNPVRSIEPRQERGPTANAAPILPAKPRGLSPPTSALPG
jgi:hypothetical protein